MHSKGEDELVISFQFLQRFEEKISCQGIHCKLGPKELWVKSETIVFLFFWVQNSFRENRLDFILIFLRIYFEKNTIYANLYSIWNDLILFLDLLNRAVRALWKEMGNIIEKYLSEHFEISSELKSKEIWINCEAFRAHIFLSKMEQIWELFLYEMASQRRLREGNCCREISLMIGFSINNFEYWTRSC